MNNETVKKAQKKVYRLRVDLRKAEQELKEAADLLNDELYPPALTNAADGAIYKLVLHDGFGDFRNASVEECHGAYPSRTPPEDVGGA